MEKLIEKYTMDKVFEVISKHKRFHEDMVNDAIVKKKMAMLLMDDDAIGIVKEYDRDIQDSASALACLTMLENELKGEVEY